MYVFNKYAKVIFDKILKLLSSYTVYIHFILGSKTLEHDLYYILSLLDLMLAQHSRRRGTTSSGFAF